jgi:hypothetical protein
MWSNELLGVQFRVAYNTVTGATLSRLTDKVEPWAETSYVHTTTPLLYLSKAYSLLTLHVHTVLTRLYILYVRHICNYLSLGSLSMFKKCHY